MPTRRHFLLTTAALATAAAAPSTEPSSPTTRPSKGIPGIDPRNQTDYFRTKIFNITDQDLFASLDLTLPALSEVRRAVDNHDYESAYRAWAAYWPTVRSRGVFTDTSDFVTTRQAATDTFRSGKAGVLAAAQTVLEHKFAGWGDVVLPQGKTIDFNADYGNSGKYGFHYWGWSRPLLHAYMLTGNEKYLAEFDKDFNDWYTQRANVRGNIPDLDVLFYELGLAVRSRPFLGYYYLPYAARPLQTHERILKTFLGAARWLYDLEKESFRPGNWQIFGSYTLALLGLQLPEFKGAPQWVHTGARRILEHREKDFYPDGCFSERCPSSYMLIAYRDPRNLATLLLNNPTYETLAKNVRAPLETTLDWYLHTLPPDGILPPINDGSRAPLPPALMQDGYDLFHRQDMLWVKDNLLDPRSEIRDPRSTTSPSSILYPPSSLSSHYPASGFTAVRSAWTRDALYLLINHGYGKGGHTHASAIDFQLYSNGRPLAVDSGIGRSYDDPLHETWYVTSPAHNMLTVDNASVPIHGAPAHNLLFSTGPHLDYLAASHSGYASKNLLVRRHYLLVARQYLITHDVITPTTSSAQHSALSNQHSLPHALTYHLHCPIPHLKLDGHTFTSQHLTVRCADNNWTPALTQNMASVSNIPGYTTPWAKIPHLTYSLTTKDPATLPVLLYPTTDPTPINFTAESNTPAAAHLIVQTPTHTDHLLLGDHASPTVTFKGAAALLRYENDRLRAWQTVAATHLAIDNQTLFTAPTNTDAHSPS